MSRQLRCKRRPCHSVPLCLFKSQKSFVFEQKPETSESAQKCLTEIIGDGCRVYAAWRTWRAWLLPAQSTQVGPPFPLLVFSPLRHCWFKPPRVDLTQCKILARWPRRSNQGLAVITSSHPPPVRAEKFRDLRCGCDMREMSISW